MRKILVTSALPYANGSIHLGHLVEYIQTDIWVRAQRFANNDVYYICADDTHGTPVMLRAEKENISPDELVNMVHKEHSADFLDFNIRFNNFYTTNSQENKELSEQIYLTLKNYNKIEKKQIEQFFEYQQNLICLLSDGRFFEFDRNLTLVKKLTLAPNITLFGFQNELWLQERNQIEKLGPGIKSSQTELPTQNYQHLQVLQDRFYFQQGQKISIYRLKM